MPAAGRDPRVGSRISVSRPGGSRRVVIRPRTFRRRPGAGLWLLTRLHHHVLHRLADRVDPADSAAELDFLRIEIAWRCPRLPRGRLMPDMFHRTRRPSSRFRPRGAGATSNRGAPDRALALPSRKLTAFERPGRCDELRRMSRWTSETRADGSCSAASVMIASRPLRSGGSRMRQSGSGTAGTGTSIGSSMRRCSGCGRQRSRLRWMGLRSIPGASITGCSERTARCCGDPFSYRDERTLPMVALAEDRLAADRLYGLTGCQAGPINTLYQLLADQHSRRLDSAERFLLDSRFIRILADWRDRRRTKRLPRRRSCSIRSRADWCWDAIDAMGSPRRMFPPVRRTGMILGDQMKADSRAAGAHSGHHRSRTRYGGGVRGRDRWRRSARDLDRDVVTGRRGTDRAADHRGWAGGELHERARRARHDPIPA